MAEAVSLLTDAEMKRLVLALAAARGERHFYEDEARQVIEWAEGVRIEAAMLQSVLDGLVTVDIDADGDLVFSLTEAGMRRAEELVADA